MSDTLTISAGQHSAAGRKAVNEDCCGIRVPDDYLLQTKGAAAVVADGVSTASDGREASEACVQGFLQDYYSTPESWTAKTSARKVLGALNRWLYGRGTRRHGREPGFATTLSALVIKSTTAYLFHVGDTRIYRWRGGALEQLTRDHCLARGGEKTFLTRAMGVDAALEIDYLAVPVEPGDLFMLTTDGVHAFVESGQLAALLDDGRQSPEPLARRIAGLAYEQGSHDNLTCQLIRVDAVPFYEDATAYYRTLTERPFPPALSPGQIMDGFRILRTLHTSKRTEVYRAEDVETGDAVVLKCPSVNYEDDAEYIDRFLHEAWVGRRINNPQVLKVLPPPRKPRFLYCVTEYCEGRTLRQWLHDRGRPSLTEVRDLMNQLMRGLLTFHRLEMVHRDIKPENILIDRNGTLKIIDFGSTRIAGIDEIDRPLAQQGTVVGTYNYSAPELMDGEPGSERCDLFSAGVIAYELLTGGHLPYGEITSPRKLRRAAYRTARDYNADIPPWMDAALGKAVEKEPGQRYALLSEFVHDLSTPNPAFTETRFQPLIERNPVRFWQLLLAGSVAVNAVLIYLLNR